MTLARGQIRQNSWRSTGDCFWLFFFFQTKQPLPFFFHFQVHRTGSAMIGTSSVTLISLSHGRIMCLKEVCWSAFSQLKWELIDLRMNKASLTCSPMGLKHAVILWEKLKGCTEFEGGKKHKGVRPSKEDHTRLLYWDCNGLPLCHSHSHDNQCH